MIRIDEDALICDLAETYQIYDYRQLPPTAVAVFSCGLRENSRINLKMSNQLVSIETLLLAGITDKLSVLLWSKTEDGQKGKNKPAMVMDSLGLTPTQEKQASNTSVFESGEDFERRREELLSQAESRGEA